MLITKFIQNVEKVLICCAAQSPHLRHRSVTDVSLVLWYDLHDATVDNCVVLRVFTIPPSVRWFLSNLRVQSIYCGIPMILNICFNPRFRSINYNCANPELFVLNFLNSPSRMCCFLSENLLITFLCKLVICLLLTMSRTFCIQKRF